MRALTIAPAAPKMRNDWRTLAPADSARIKCQGPWALTSCDAQAAQCNTVEWAASNASGISFFYHCGECARQIQARRAAAIHQECSVLTTSEKAAD